MKHMPLISIIIPIYNTELYLEKCIASIQAQTYENLEILLVDDGSTDASGAICDKAACGDDRIQVIHKNNGGLSDARNTGLKMAKGDYIGFVDGDDFVEPVMYERMMHMAQTYHADIVECIRKIIYPNGVVKATRSNARIALYTGEEALAMQMTGKEGFPTPRWAVWSKLFAKSVIMDLYFPKGMIHEDIFFDAIAFLRTKQYVMFDEPLYCYNMREGSILRSKFSVRDFSKLDLMQQRTTYLREKGYHTLADQSQNQLYHFLIIYYYNSYRADLSECVRRTETLILSDKHQILDSKLSRIKRFEYRMFYLSPTFLIALENTKYAIANAIIKIKTIKLG